MGASALSIGMSKWQSVLYLCESLGPVHAEESLLVAGVSE